MSLLMEALRKAEEAKRRMQHEEQAAPGKDPRENPGAQPSSPAANLRSTGLSLEEREPDVTPDYIADNFTGSQDAGGIAEQDNDAPPPEPVPAPEPGYARQVAPEIDPGARTLARRQQRAAAASIFVAKQHPTRNRNMLTILVIVMVLMIPVGGGVLWYLQSAAGSSLINPTIASYDLSSRGFVDEAAAPATAAAAPPAVAETAGGQGVDTGAAAVEQPAPALPEPIAAEIAGETADPNANATTAVVEIAVEPAAETVVAIPPQAPVDASVAAADTPVDSGFALPQTNATAVLEVSRSGGIRQVNPQLVAAYDRLQAGDLLVAGQLYQEVLVDLPNSRDALLGLALVHSRQGDLVSAREHYARALQLNPRDPLAHTGLLQTMQVSDAAEHESTLKMLIGEYPDVAQLTLALGNLYAAQQRWSEAQGAYYNALLTASRSTGGPVHPDYAFNLAVSLEQLNQKRAALDYYRQAQALARDITPGFDPQQLNSRLDYLSTQAQP